jgi:hypothetical protein
MILKPFEKHVNLVNCMLFNGFFKLDPMITFSARHEAFQIGYEKGFLEFTKWFYRSARIDIHLDNEYAFRWACGRGHLDVSQWLYSLGNVNIHVKEDVKLFEELVLMVIYK